MIKISTLLLKFVILLIGVAVFAGMIYFPQTEGRATNLDLVSIYADPLIIYTYIGSVPFFVGLYQAFRLLDRIDVKRLRNIKFAALSLIGFIAPALFYIRFASQGDDPAGPIMLGIIVILATTVVAATAHVLERVIRKKS